MTDYEILKKALEESNDMMYAGEHTSSVLADFGDIKLLVSKEGPDWLEILRLKREVIKLSAKPEITDELVERCAIAQWDAVPYHVKATEYMKVNPEGWKGHLRFIRAGLGVVLR